MKHPAKEIAPQRSGVHNEMYDKAVAMKTDCFLLWLAYRGKLNRNTAALAASDSRHYASCFT